MGVGRVVGLVVALGITGAVVAGFVGSDPVVVEKIVDGDTIDVVQDGESTRIRFLNVNTPEIGRDGNPSECLAEEAKQKLESLIPVGTEVTLKFDEEREDKYWRTLAGVYHGDTLINAEIAREGLGVAVDIAPNHRFFSEVEAAEKEAEAADRGIATLGPECFVAPENSTTIANAQATTDEALALIPVLAALDKEENFSKALTMASRLEQSLTALKKMNDAGVKQSEFQKSAFGDEYEQPLKAVEQDLQRTLDKFETAVEKEERRQEAVKREEGKRRAEAEVKHPAATDSEPIVPKSEAPGSVAPKPEIPEHEAPTAPKASGGADKYTTCRAYNGNYAFTSVDDEGGVYAKIDCTTKAQIG